jgi:hypothetical protein
MGVDRGGSSPSQESERCMAVCIPGSILTLTRGGVLKMEVEEWGEVRNSVEAFVEESGSPYTVYLPVPNSHIDDPLSATIGISRMVNDNKEISVS